MIPTSHDRVAVAMLFAARIAYSAHRQWHAERYGSRLPDWEDCTNTTHGEWVDKVLVIAGDNDLKPQDIHRSRNSQLIASGVADVDALLSWNELPPRDKLDDAMTVSIIRTVLAELVAPKEIEVYIARLNTGEDEFMQAH